MMWSEMRVFINSKRGGVETSTRHWSLEDLYAYIKNCISSTIFH
jgi:hypothetical protein